MWADKGNRKKMARDIIPLAFVCRITSANRRSVCAKPCKRPVSAGPQPLSAATWLNWKTAQVTWRWRLMAEKPTYLPLSCDKPDLLGKPQNKTKKKNTWLLIERWSTNPKLQGTGQNVTELTEWLLQRTNKAPRVTLDDPSLAGEASLLK